MKLITIPIPDFNIFPKYIPYNDGVQVTLKAPVF